MKNNFLTIFSDEFIPDKQDYIPNSVLNYNTNLRYYNKKENNLKFLVKSRYLWMNKYLINKKTIEIGSGSGLIKDIFPNYDITTTDIENTKYIDYVLDANNINSSISNYNVVIFSNVLHHLDNPVLTLKKLHENLKIDSFILINESSTSLLSRIIMYFLNHEGWSYKNNPYDYKKTFKFYNTPMSGNNALAKMIFDDNIKFTNTFPKFKILTNIYTESLIFLISGGVGKKYFTIQLPNTILNLLYIFDKFISKYFYLIFPLCRRIIIKIV